MGTNPNNKKTETRASAGLRPDQVVKVRARLKVQSHAKLSSRIAAYCKTLSTTTSSSSPASTQPVAELFFEARGRIGE